VRQAGPAHKSRIRPHDGTWFLYCPARMSERPRIGEILLLRESIDSQQLMQAIRDQADRPGERLVSMLIKRTQLDPDEGALALSEQTGFPAALQRHLEGRHEDTHALMPAPLAQRWVVLPVGRAREGTLVVCARDPTPILAAALRHALDTPIKLAVAPAILVERLISSVYGPVAPVEGAEQPSAQPAPPSIADIGAVTVDEHDMRPPRTVSRMFRGRPDSGLMAAARPLDTLEATLQEIDHAFSIAAVERQVLAYAAQRWRAALLVKIVDGIAMGHRGHGERLGSAEAFMIPVSSPTLIQIAHDTRDIAVEQPQSEVQSRLADLLGDAEDPVAGPAISNGRVEAVLVVGDPLGGTLRDTVAELERLVDALGAGYQRFARTPR